MKPQDVKLYSPKGEPLSHDDLVFLSSDTEKKYPIRRIARWALNRTSKDLNADCAGMEGEGDFSIDAFWNYFSNSFPELIPELSGESEFENILIENYEL